MFGAGLTESGRVELPFWVILRLDDARGDVCINSVDSIGLQCCKKTAKRETAKRVDFVGFSQSDLLWCQVLLRAIYRVMVHCVTQRSRDRAQSNCNRCLLIETLESSRDPFEPRTLITR